MAVKVIAKTFLDRIGYDLQIVDENASLQDYLEALNQHFLEGELTRTRYATSKCEGCDSCCSERIPLTNIDILMLQKGLEAQGEKRALEEVVRRYAYVVAEGSVVDITLARDELGRCIFLNPETRKCKIYSFRPLVCQTFICSPSTSAARELRQTVVNLGEDQLVKWCLTNIPWERLFNQVWEPEISLDDWENTHTFIG
jgi:Fe-S-cluster containining protein